MKKIIISIALLIAITHIAESLAPIRAVLRNSGNNLSVELNDYSTGSAVAVSSAFGTKELDSIAPNSSGIVTLVIGEGDEDWGDIMPSQINSNVILDVYDDSTLVAQFRVDELIEESALGSQLPADVKVGGNLGVDTNLTVGGDIETNGDMKVKGIIVMNSNEFKDSTELSGIINNVMVFVGTNDEDFDEDDFNDNLPDNATYILVNDSPDAVPPNYPAYFTLNLNGETRYADQGQTISIIKIDGHFFFLMPNFGE